MRIICQSVNEFLENLKAEGPGAVWNGVVYVSRIRQPVDADKFKAVHFRVTLQASAVICRGDDEQYVLEVGEFCGDDYVDAQPSKEGSVWMDQLYDRIKAFCEDGGLEIRPGIIGE